MLFRHLKSNKNTTFRGKVVIFVCEQGQLSNSNPFFFLVFFFIFPCCFFFPEHLLVYPLIFLIFSDLPLTGDTRWPHHLLRSFSSLSTPFRSLRLSHFSPDRSPTSTAAATPSSPRSSSPCIYFFSSLRTFFRCCWWPPDEERGRKQEWRREKTLLFFFFFFFNKRKSRYL
ncbi:unnamed protein product [Trifolium pratense]|uniref:Uncharacterized protein n=1 Tax=Trifolium pratense TaxID=57577 RepID=A0ACB0LZZ3_TRIPR|nr:unnamed protein product [Trifolium pratense]